jgi:pyridoxine 5-phosphate synthase
MSSSSFTRLSVNVNKIALLRNSRGTDVPNLIDYSRIALEAGADGLTVHPRVDERHITRNDARAIAKEFKNLTEINFEGDIREDFLELVFECKPHQCTLVPVSPGEVTSHRGFDFDKWGFLLAPVIKRIQENGTRVSLFVSPEPGVATKAALLGADAIEIYTEPFAKGHASKNQATLGAELNAIRSLEAEALAAGIRINAGHDLTLENLGLLLDTAPSIQEVSIGHHLISTSILNGFKQTIRDFKNICTSPRPRVQ